MSNRPKLQSSQNGRGGADRAASRLSPLQKWVIIGLIALVLAAVVVAVTRDAADRVEDAGLARAVDEAQVSDVTIVGDSLPRFTPPPGDPAVGLVAPAIRASTFDGRDVNVQPGDGRSKVIGFFAHWCPHCQRELPRMTEWLAENQLPVGVDLIAVSTAVDPDGSNYPPSAWFEEVGWPELALRDSSTSEIGSGYGLAGFPYLVVLDGSGAVITRVSGELSTSAWEALLDLAEAAAG